MQKIARANVRWSSLLFAAFVGLAPISFLAAQVSPPASNRKTVAPVTVERGHAFGDTTVFAVKVLSFNRANETAEVFLRKPDNVIVLAVEPGRDIEVIFPGAMKPKKLDSNKFAFAMQRFEVVPAEPSQGESTRARQSYERCMGTRAALQREAAQRVRRDSTGKIISGGDTPIGREPPTCDLIRSGNQRMQTVAMPPRPERERYLVILSSSEKVGLAELEERMQGLSTVVSDVALTIEAIAAGIYVGKSKTYGGTYVSW